MWLSRENILFHSAFVLEKRAMSQVNQGTFLVIMHGAKPICFWLLKVLLHHVMLNQ